MKQRAFSLKRRLLRYRRPLQRRPLLKRKSDLNDY
jgi:hypothetical protein